MEILFLRTINQYSGARARVGTLRQSGLLFIGAPNKVALLVQGRQRYYRESEVPKRNPCMPSNGKHEPETCAHGLSR